MDERDKNYYQEYLNLIKKYSKSLSLNDIDIFKGYNPPKDLYVEVRALDDIGIIDLKDSGNYIICIIKVFCMFTYLILKLFEFLNIDF